MTYTKGLAKENRSCRSRASRNGKYSRPFITDVDLNTSSSSTVKPPGSIKENEKLVDIKSEYDQIYGICSIKILIWLRQNFDRFFSGN